MLDVRALFFPFSFCLSAVRCHSPGNMSSWMKRKTKAEVFGTGGTILLAPFSRDRDVPCTAVLRNSIV